MPINVLPATKANRALIKALRYRDEAGALAALEAGADANAFDLTAYRHALYYAQECSEALSNALLERGAHPIVSVVDEAVVPGHRVSGKTSNAFLNRIAHAPENDPATILDWLERFPELHSTRQRSDKESRNGGHNSYYANSAAEDLLQSLLCEGRERHLMAVMGRYPHIGLGLRRDYLIGQVCHYTYSFLGFETLMELNGPWSSKEVVHLLRNHTNRSNPATRLQMTRWAVRQGVTWDTWVYEDRDALSQQISHFRVHELPTLAWRGAPLKDKEPALFHWLRADTSDCLMAAWDMRTAWVGEPPSDAHPVGRMVKVPLAFHEGWADALDAALSLGAKNCFEALWKGASVAERKAWVERPNSPAWTAWSTFYGLDKDEKTAGKYVALGKRLHQLNVPLPTPGFETPHPWWRLIDRQIMLRDALAARVGAGHRGHALAPQDKTMHELAELLAPTPAVLHATYRSPGAGEVTSEGLLAWARKRAKNSGTDEVFAPVHALISHYTLKHTLVGPETMPTTAPAPRRSRL